MPCVRLRNRFKNTHVEATLNHPFPAPEVAVDDEAEEAREGLDVDELLGREEGAEGRDLRRVAGEVVGPDAEDAVEEEDARRLPAVVRRAVLVAELEVVHEGPVGVLHGEVALLVHEGQDPLVVVRRPRHRRERALDPRRRRLSPERLPRQLAREHRARQGAPDVPEDRRPEVEARVRDERHLAAVVLGPEKTRARRGAAATHRGGPGRGGATEGGRRRRTRGPRRGTCGAYDARRAQKERGLDTSDAAETRRLSSTRRATAPSPFPSASSSPAASSRLLRFNAATATITEAPKAATATLDWFRVMVSPSRVREEGHRQSIILDAK